MEVMQLADIIIGGAGYNTVYECAALNIPLITFPLRRQYDRQAQRGFGEQLASEDNFRLYCHYSSIAGFDAGAAHSNQKLRP